MYQEYTLGVLITLLSSITAIVVIGAVSRTHKTKRLTLLFTGILFLNSIWLSTLIFYYFKPFFPEPASPDKIYWFEFLILSLIYLIRFGMLIALLSLIRHILGLAVSRKIISVVRNGVMVFSAIWFVSWIEIPWLGSRYMVDQLMVLTDFMIFMIVIAAAVYLRYRAVFIPDLDYKKAIIILSGIIVFPLVIGSVKLVIGSSLGKITYILERSMVYLTLMSFNALIVWWGVKYASILEKYDSLELSVKNMDLDGLVRKYKITKREIEVIELICRGKTNREIADQLFISVETVKDHNYKIFQKTGVKNRIQLVNLFNSLQKES